MRRLNYAVDGEHRAPAEVAREFLLARGRGAAERLAVRELVPGRVEK